MPAEFESKDRRRLLWATLAPLGFFMLFLLPAIETGYYGEDLIHSMTPGIARVEGRSTAGLLARNIQSSLEQGRFFPLTPLLFVGVHTMARDVVTYKAVIVAGTVLDLLLFILLVRKLTRSGGFATFAACVTIGLIQFRIQPDPVLGYYLQVQLVAAALFASLLALLLYLDGRGRGWLAISCATYLLGALTYEVSYPFFLMHLLLIGRGRAGWRGRLKASSPILGVVGACAVMTLLVRRMSLTEAHYVHNLDAGAVPYLTAVSQMASAAFPLSYFLADPHDIFPDGGGISAFLRWWPQPMAIVVMLVGSAIVFRALRKPGNADARPESWSPTAFGLGLMLLVLPTLLIALSPFHRVQIHLGAGWMPVLIQCHGMGLVLATLAWMLIKGRALGGPFSRRKCLGVAALVAAVTGVTYRANEQVAACLNAPWGTREFRDQAAIHGGGSFDQRRLLESALGAGLADEVPERSLVLLSHRYHLWHDIAESLYFYAAYASKVLVTAVPEAQDSSSKEHAILVNFLEKASVTASSGSPYRLRDVCLSRGSGFVLLWQLQPAPSEKKGDGNDREVRLFVKHPGLFAGGTSPGFRMIGGPKGPESARPGPGLTVLRSGRDWGLFSISPGKAPVDPESLRVVFDPSGRRL